MAILHGGWSNRGDFLLWAETWQRVDPYAAKTWLDAVPAHPLALAEEPLTQYLKTLPQAALTHVLAANIRGEGVLSLPTQVVTPDRQNLASDGRKRQKRSSSDLPITAPAELAYLPLHSGQDLDTVGDNVVLMPWRIPYYVLPAALAFEFLSQLPLGQTSPGVGESLGQDLRFWSHGVRWVLDLWSRSEFVPALGSGATPNHLVVTWDLYLDGENDRLRLDRFAQQMPPIAQQVIQELDPLERVNPANMDSGESEASPTIVTSPLLPTPQTHLRSCLNRFTDHTIRQVLNHPPALDLDPLFQNFWQHLSQRETQPLHIPEESQEVWERWQRMWDHWIQTDDGELREKSRPCLQLHAPQDPSQPWILEYGLQVAGPESPMIPARILWQHTADIFHYGGHDLHHPQERLLRGLGLALGVYPDLETSLQAQQPTHHSLNTQEAYQFIKTTAKRLTDQGLAVILPAGLTSGQGVANRLGLQIKAELAVKAGPNLGLNNLLQFRWELCLGGQTFTKAQFDRLVAQAIPRVQVNGEWLELRDQDVTAAREFFKSRKDQPSLSLEDALRLSTGDAQTISKLPVVNFEATGTLQELVTTLTGHQRIEPLIPPDGFQGQLRPYQERGAGWLKFLHRWNLGACLADDMGLGKTIQFLAFLWDLQHLGQLERPYLLLCPTSVLGNWEREAQRFAPRLKLWVHHGEKRLKGAALHRKALAQQLVITSYSLVHRDLADLQGVAWQGLVLDEAQMIKNSGAKQTVAVQKLLGASKESGSEDQPLPFRIALTGTPVENRLGELWSIMEFLNPGYLGSKAFFQRRFTLPIERYGDRDSLLALRNLVQPFILRRLKTDRSIIQDLPEKQEMTVFCGLSQEQGDLYQRVVDETLATIDGAEGIEKQGLILGLLTKLKQICNHPSLFLKEELGGSKTGKGRKATLNTSDAFDVAKFAQRSSKIQRLESLLDELLAEGDRALLFTQFAEWGKLLKTYLETLWGQEVLFLYGGTTKTDRQAMIDRFQEDPQAPRLLILSLKAGGVGLNLTRANHVFHVDRWWNPAVENQATDRAFRIGQTRKVQVHKFVCRGTLEERIHDLIESKKALADQVVGTGESWLTQLDSGQLRDLLLLNQDAIDRES